jgi:hypothetical protein
MKPRMTARLLTSTMRTSSRTSICRMMYRTGYPARTTTERDGQVHLGVRIGGSLMPTQSTATKSA